MLIPFIESRREEKKAGARARVKSGSPSKPFRFGPSPRGDFRRRRRRRGDAAVPRRWHSAEPRLSGNI